MTVDPALDEVKRYLKLDTNELETGPHIMILSASYLELCEKRGCKFFDNSQKASINHIISLVQSPLLRARMEESMELDRADLENIYFRFMWFLA